MSTCSLEGQDAAGYQSTPEPAALRMGSKGEDVGLSAPMSCPPTRGVSSGEAP
jgi:hypothetical protein